MATTVLVAIYSVFDYFVIPHGSLIPVDGTIKAKTEIDARLKIIKRHNYPIDYIGVKPRQTVFRRKRAIQTCAS